MLETGLGSGSKSLWERGTTESESRQMDPFNGRNRSLDRYYDVQVRYIIDIEVSGIIVYMIVS